MNEQDEMIKITHENRRVLVVEDEPRLRDMLVRAIRQMEFIAEGVSSAEDAIPLFNKNVPDIIVLDLNLPGMHGLAFHEHIYENYPDTQTIILTGYGSLESAQKAIHLNVVDFLAKPCSLADLESALDRALRRKMYRKIPHPSDDLIRAMSEPEEDELIDTDIPQTLAELERQCILSTLRRNGGNRGDTSKELGISLRKLYYRLSQYEKQGYEV